MSSWMEVMTGRCLNQWWDVSSDAGPNSRGNSQFPEQLPQLEVLTVSDGALQTFSSTLVVFFINFHLKFVGVSVFLTYEFGFDDFSNNLGFLI